MNQSSSFGSVESPSYDTPASIASARGTWKPAKPENGWTCVLEGGDGYAFFEYGLSVILSGEIHEGKRWLHLSLARKSRMPEYGDLDRVKRAFLGDGARAIMVMPERAMHVNIHQYCLHLFSCPEGDGLPEFSAILGGRRTL